MSLEGAQLGHYRLTRFLKGGGMGEVYLAEDLSLPREVAIKVVKGEESLYPDSQAAQEAERLFQREMKVIAALDHPNILALYEAGEQNVKHERITYMVMPYCPAGSLADWIRQHHGSSWLLPLEVSHLLLQAGEALQYAHGQGILHLDIKPQNFLVRRQENPTALPNLLLADFGIAKIANVTKMSETARGTYLYMAPEQLQNKPVPASDQYALAIMVYELLVGRTPFAGVHPQVISYQHAQMMPDPPSRVNPSLPSALDGVILKALAKKPEDRFPSVREFAQAFAAALRPAGSQGSGAYTGATQATPISRSSSPFPSAPSPPSYSAYSPSWSDRPYLSPPGYPPYQPSQQYQQPLPLPSPGQQIAGQPSQGQKRGFRRALLFGGIAAVLVYIVGFALHFSGIFLLAGCLIPMIAGFMASRIILRKRVGTLTGFITGIIAAFPIACIALVAFIANHMIYSFLYIVMLLGIYVAVSTLFGFIGGWLGTIGRVSKQT